MSNPTKSSGTWTLYQTKESSCHSLRKLVGLQYNGSALFSSLSSFCTKTFDCFKSNILKFIWRTFFFFETIIIDKGNRPQEITQKKKFTRTESLLRCKTHLDLTFYSFWNKYCSPNLFCSGRLQSVQNIRECTSTVDDIFNNLKWINADQPFLSLQNFENQK